MLGWLIIGGYILVGVIVLLVLAFLGGAKIFELEDYELEPLYIVGPLFWPLFLVGLPIGFTGWKLWTWATRMGERLS